MNKYWKFIKAEKVYSDNVLDIERKTYFYGKINDSMPFTVINTKDWAIIIPELENGNFVMVKQFRVAANSVTIEFPGGALNKNEDKKEGALRELREETGLKTENLKFLGTLMPNPAILSNSCYVYYAQKCKFAYDTNFDNFEDIEIIEMSKDDFKRSVKEGKISHSLVLSSYSLLLLN